MLSSLAFVFAASVFSPKTISEVGKPGDGPSTIKANDAVLACIAADKKAKRDEVSGLGRAPG
jgi:hypothetical protein